MDISILHLLFLVIVLGSGVATFVIYLYLGFSAVRLLRDIRDTLREKQSTG